MSTQHPNDPKGAVGATKCPLHLLPPHALRETAWVHKLGAEKYGPFNWRTHHVNATTYVAAIMRHLMAWSEGEDLDPESGITHLAHVAASCNILMDAQATRTLVDDRHKTGPEEEDGPWAEGWEERSNSWREHTGKSECPCDIEAWVEVALFKRGSPTQIGEAREFNWAEIAGWRYADEWHNPDNLSSPGDGYRFLRPHELDGRFAGKAELWDPLYEAWRSAINARVKSTTYRVRV